MRPNDDANSSKKGMHVSQESQLLADWAVTFDVGHPGPGDGDRTFAVSQAEDQQLMAKAHFRPVYDQPDLLDILSYSFVKVSDS